MKLTKYIPSKEIQQLGINIAFSGFGQLITLASPLLITPYLIRVVGIEKFGVIILAQSIMMYVSYLVDYSFNIDATQEASVNRNDSIKLIYLFSNILWSKLLLMIAGAVLVLLAVHTIPTFFIYKKLFFLSYSIVVGKTLLPQWLLIGTERIKEYTIITTVSKVFVYLSVLMLINQPTDYIYVNLLWGGGEIVLAPFIYAFLYRKLGINRLIFPSVAAIKARLIDGWPLFASNSVNSLYIYSNMTILSLFATPRELGSYAIAEKVMQLLKQIVGTIFQTTYPYVCKLTIQSQQKVRSFLQIETYVFVLLFGLGGIMILFSADYITMFFAGQPNTTASFLLRCLAFVPLLVSLNMSASQIMLANGIRKRYLQVITVVAITNILLNFALVPFLSATGTVIAIMVTEVINTLGVHTVLFKYHKQLVVFNIHRLLARPLPTLNG